MDTLPGRIAAVAARAPERVAIEDDDGRSITYGAFWQAARGFAHALRERGLARGDRVAVLLPNRIEAAVAYYGIWLAGGVAVALNAQAKARDIAPWLRHSGATDLICEASHRDAQEAVDRLRAENTALQVWQLANAEALPAGRGDTPDQAMPPRADTQAGSQADSAALILYTSGTTGAPKGVTLSHRNLLVNAEAVVRYLQLGPDDSVLSILAFYYAYGSSVLHTHLLSGARVVLAQNLLFPHLLMKTAAQHRVTGLSGVPSTFALLLERVKLADYDLSSLRYITQAGGAMPQALAARLRSALPAPALYVMYGQTEATSRLTWLPPERLDDKPGSVGIPVDGMRLCVLREDGSDAAPGESGEVCASGPGVMLGYWNDPDATARAVRGGWLHTGDIGRLDEEGFLYLDGRRSDMIKTGAHRVHPRDIEEAIAELDGVVEAAAIGVDDPLLGQAVRVFVVAPGLRTGDAGTDADRIKAHCRRQLATFKIPRDVLFVDALPRTASGKVRRAALNDLQAT